MYVYVCMYLNIYVYICIYIYILYIIYVVYYILYAYIYIYICIYYFHRYAPDYEWYISTMNEVFELGGNLVPKDIVYNVMMFIGEGMMFIELIVLTSKNEFPPFCDANYFQIIFK